MFCDNCGGQMAPNGVCPVCGYQKNVQPTYPGASQGYNQNQAYSNVNQGQSYNQGVQNQSYPGNVPGYNQNQQLNQGYPSQNYPGVNQGYNQASQNQMYNQARQSQGYPVQNQNWQQGYGNQQGMPSQQGYGNQQGMPNQQGYSSQQGYANQGYGGQQNRSMPIYNQQVFFNQGQSYNRPTGASTKPTPPPKKKKWPLVTGIVAGVLALSITTVVLLNKDKDDDNKKKKPSTTEYVETTEKTTEATTEASTYEVVVGDEGTKTIMVYMVGSNLESDHYAASDDIEEMLDSGLNEDNVNLLIYTGGADDWHTSGIPDDENAAFLVENGDLTELYTEAERNMGDANVLADFLNYGYSNFPAEQYGVILWNHGGGSFFGYGYDEKTNDSLTLSELQTAFNATPFKDNKLEFIGFDACLMATIETADALSPFANYLIASQESEPGWGWDYCFLKDIDTMSTGDEIGTAVVDQYIDTCESNFSVNFFSYSDVTLSCMDLSKVGNVEVALNDLYANVSLDNASFAKHSRIRSTTKEIATIYSGEESYDVVDLKNLAEKMTIEYPAEASALANAVDEFIIHTNSNELNANGVSIYYPYNAKQMASQYYIPMYYAFDFAPNYASFIDSFATMLNGDTTITSNWDPSTLIPVLNGDGTFSLQLDDAQAADVQNVYFAISRADVDQPGKFIFVSLNNQVEMSESNNLTALFDGQITYMANNVTYDMYEIMYQIEEETDSYSRYLISAILYNEDINEDAAMYCYFEMERTPENPQGVLLGVHPIADLMEDDEMSGLFPNRLEINLDDYTFVAFGCLSHEFTSEEDLTDFNEADWEDVDIWYNSMMISDGFSTVLDGMIPDVPYYGMFIIEDTQGNRHASSLVQIQ